MSDVTSILIWWLLLQAMGWVALPLVFRLLRWLPDRGYSVAKPAGMLLGNYVLWLLGSLGWLRNTEGGILAAFGLVALFGVWVYRRWDDGPKLMAWLREHLRWIIAYEAVFLAAFVFWAIFRAHNPDLSTTEKPMEFAFMNGIDRSVTFPPRDPWLSGFGISYYYFGYVMMATLAKLSGVASGVAFSLSNALWFALTAAGAFGIASNLVAASKRATTTAIVATGLLSALFVSTLGNFEGALDVAHTNDIGPSSIWRLFGVERIEADWLPAPLRDNAGFWRWLDVLELNAPPTPLQPGEARWPFCSAEGCPPHPRGNWWFWRASRVVHDYPLGSTRTDPAEYQEVIDEFPFFSFLLGDMHPHVLALPYALMSMALAFNAFRMGAASAAESAGDASYRRRWRYWFWQTAPIAMTYPVFLGALSFLNTWDFPIHVFIVALAWGVGRWLSQHLPSPLRDGGPRESPPTKGIWSDALAALIACGVIGVAAYLPFYVGFRSQAAGVVPNVYNPTAIQQFFVMFGPFVLIGGAFIVAALVRAMRQGRVTVVRGLAGTFGGGAAIVVIAALATAAASVVVVSISSGARAKVDEWTGILDSQGISLSQVIGERLTQFGVPLLLGVMMAAIMLVLWSRRGGEKVGDESRPSPTNDEPAAPFALLLFGVGALLVFAVEYVYLLDQFGYRMNTVFKFYYQAWALWGVASAYAVYHVWRSSERATNIVARVVFAGVVTIGLAGGLVYPLLGVWSGTLGRPLRDVIDSQTGETISLPIDPTLDARAPTMQFAPDEVAAIDWLIANAGDGAVILEAEGQSYHDNTSRLAAWSGVPTVLGWVGHEGQWRGVYDDISPRQPDIDLIYSTLDLAQTLNLLRKYNVEYVYVGPNETGKYPPEGLAKFAAMMGVVFQQGGSALYRVRDAGATSLR